MFAELQPPSPATMRHISRRAVLLCLGCYALIGTAGYVNFPHKRESNVLSNYELDEPHSRMMAPSFGAIALTVLMARARRNVLPPAPAAPLPEPSRNLPLSRRTRSTSSRAATRST